ncbi:MAG: TssN family type VI secretion system protein [Chitinophagales bacterium]|nr:TssN family type VI secretion system protein [Chitinophagales bacterium]
MSSQANLLVPGIFFTIAAALGSVFMIFKKDGKKVSIKSFVIYTVAILLIFALSGLTGLMESVSPVSLHGGLQILCFAVGAIYAATLYKLNSWPEPESFWREALFTLYLAVLGAVGFLFVFTLLNKEGYALVLSGAFLLFLIPFLIMKCFDLMIAIPMKEYTKWYFPVGHDEIIIPDEYLDDANIVVVEFRMLRATEDDEVIKSRSKLPLKMDLGTFFPVFLEQYNDRNPGKAIQFMDAAKQGQAWNFYVQPKKMWMRKVYINPTITIRENGIKENDIIVAERV